MRGDPPGTSPPSALVEVMQLDVRIRPGLDDGAAQGAARLGRISVVPPQAAIVVAHTDTQSHSQAHSHSRCHSAMVIVVRQGGNVVVVVEGSASGGVAMDEGHAHAVSQRQGRRRRRGRGTGGQIVVQGQGVVRIVVDVARLGHCIAGLGIDAAVVVALVRDLVRSRVLVVVVEVVLGEPDSVGQRLAVVGQRALLDLDLHLRRRRSVARQRGGIEGLAAVAGQQAHVLLRVVHLGGLAAVVGHVVDVAELSEGVGGLVDGAGHLQLLHRPAGGAGATPAPQLRRGWCF